MLGYAAQVATGMAMQGWALSEQSRGKGLPLLRQGITAYQATGARAGLSAQLAWLAEAYGHARQVEEGLAAVTQALDVVDNCFYPSLQTIKPKPKPASTTPSLLPGTNTPNPVDSALPPASSTCGSLKTSARTPTIYSPRCTSGFTERFDTADLQEAQALLEELGE